MSLPVALESSLKVFPIRLRPGTELKSSLIKFVAENELKSAFVMTCVGSVTKATLRFAEKEDGSQKDVSKLSYVFPCLTLMNFRKVHFGFIILIYEQ
jgi:predicted DNA-binding protein with PD1-like motif